MYLAVAFGLLLSVHMTQSVAAERCGTGWSLVVLFDVSASMGLGPRESEALLAAVRVALVTRQTSEEHIRVGVFASEVRLSARCGKPEDAIRVLQEALTGDGAGTYGPSRLWDAVEEASGVVAAEPGHRVVVVVSDGRATGNAISRAQVADSLRARGVDLWVIRALPGFGDDALRAFASAIDGQIFDGHAGRRPDPGRTALTRALSEVLEALRAGALE